MSNNEQQSLLGRSGPASINEKGPMPVQGSDSGFMFPTTEPNTPYQQYSTTADVSQDAAGGMFPSKLPDAEELDEERPRKGCRHCLHKWKPVLLAVVMVILQASSGNVLVPILPGLKRDYFGSDKKAAMVQTILDSIVALLSVAAAPFWGLIMDVVGRRPFIIYNAFSIFVPVLILLLSLENPLPYMIAQSATGLVTGTAMSAYLADHYTPKLRVTAFAAVSAAGNLSSGVTLLVMGLSDKTLVIVSVALAGASVLFTIFFMKESLPKEQVQEFQCAKIENPFKAMKSVLNSKVMILAVVIMGAFSVSQAGIVEVYMFYLNEKVGFDKKDNAIIFLELAILQPIVYLGLIPFLTRIVGLRQISLIIISTCALAAEMIVMCVVWTKWPVFAFGLPCASLVNMSYPAIMAIIANGSDGTDQGRRQAGLGALNGFFGTFAPLFFGQLYSHLSPKIDFLPFAIAAVMSIPTMYVALRLRRLVIEGEEVADDAASIDSPQFPSSDESNSGELIKTQPEVIV